MTKDVLNASGIPPRKRHGEIFQKFYSLPDNESFILVNDHDPKPLYYQFSAEHPGKFFWEYIQEGPDEWKVEIGKRTNSFAENTVGEIVANDFRASEVFKKLGIDFCCGGNKTVAQVCKEHNIDPDQLRKELTKPDKNEHLVINRFKDWPLEFLVDYILVNHHAYVKQSLREMPAYIHKVASVHGEKHPETIQIATAFDELAGELQSHLQKEEMILFPFIRKLTSVAENRDNGNNSPAADIKNPIRVMEAEHETAGEMLARIRIAADDYRLPEDACSTYKLVYDFLQEFETDLHQHIHLENNVLFPAAKQLFRENR